MFQLPFVPAYKLDAALQEIETLKQERDDETRKAAEARRDATTLAAQRDQLADEVERSRCKNILLGDDLEKMHACLSRHEKAEESLKEEIRSWIRTMNERDAEIDRLLAIIRDARDIMGKV